MGDHSGSTEGSDHIYDFGVGGATPGVLRVQTRFANLSPCSQRCQATATIFITTTIIIIIITQPQVVKRSFFLWGRVISIMDRREIREGSGGV